MGIMWVCYRLQKVGSTLRAVTLQDSWYKKKEGRIGIDRNKWKDKMFRKSDKEKR